jgi:hypothetical protein
MNKKHLFRMGFQKVNIQAGHLVSSTLLKKQGVYAKVDEVFQNRQSQSRMNIRRKDNQYFLQH